MELKACTCGKAPSMLKCIYGFYSNMFSHPDDVFFREGLAYFNKTMLNLPLHLLSQQTGLPAVQTFDQLKTFLHHEIRQKRILHQHSSPEGGAAGLLSSQMFTDCC